MITFKSYAWKIPTFQDSLTVKWVPNHPHSLHPYYSNWKNLETKYPVLFIDKVGVWTIYFMTFRNKDTLPPELQLTWLGPRSREMSQNGSIVVDTPLRHTRTHKSSQSQSVHFLMNVPNILSIFSWLYLQDWQTTSDCKPPVKIWSIIQLQWWGLLLDIPFEPWKWKHGI